MNKKASTDNLKLPEILEAVAVDDDDDIMIINEEPVSAGTGWLVKHDHVFLALDVH